MKLNKNILDSIAQFENIIGYRFNNKEYILEALTHSSYSNENKGYNFNERLEFLGDSILSIVISDYLFKKETELPEGELTKLRANIVCEESLSEVAISIKLGEYMLLGKGEEATALEDAKRALDSDPDNMQYQLLYQRIASGGSWYAGRRTQYQGPSSTTYCTGCAPWVALCLCSNICMPMCCGYGSGGYYPGGSI